METKELRDELTKLVADVIEIDEFADDDNFVEDLGVDSMVALEIVYEIEKKLKVVIPAKHIKEMETLNDVIKMVSEKLDSKS
ncbi:acyl carrier protein [Paenibacillus sp. FSL W7-1279]|uniref:acyl carrier protein n=1 Tax=unclassified Paenibacillus TaxID=185978 RepID=UPI00188A8AFE|nr:acyl carrier protein [Paenibacillus sp. JZ16]